MKSSLQKYKIIFDTSVSAILFTTPEGIIVEVNKTAEEMFGYTLQEFVRLGRKDIIDHSEGNIEQLMHERKEKGSIKAELIAIRKNGERFPVKVNSTLFADDDGAHYICTSMQDISVRKKSEQEMAVMMDNTGESFIFLNANLNVVSFSKELQNLGKKYLGFEVKKGNSIFDYAQPERIADLKAMYARVLKGATEKSNITIPVADDSNRYFALTHAPTKDEKGTIIGVFVTTRDVTEETESQLAITETKAELDKIMDFSLDVICTIDGNGNFVKVSKASEKVWGYSPEELVGQNYKMLVHPDDLEQTKAAILEVVAGFNQTNFQNTNIKKDGAAVPIVWSAKWDDTEKLMFCVAKDATEKVKKEEALVESEKLYKNLFENGPAPMFIFDFKTLQIIDCNEETLLKYGYTKEEFLSLTIKDIRPPEDIEKLERAVADESVYGRIHKNIWRHQKKNGDIMFMDISGHLMTYKGRRMSLVILIDITETIKIEEKLKESIERYENVTKATSDAIWDWDLVTNVTYRAEGFKTSFGFNLEELNAAETVWDNYIHPEDRAHVQESITDFINGNENFWRNEYRIIKPDGQIAFVQDNAFFIRDEKGSATRIIGGMQDITLRKQEELLLKLMSSVVTNTVDAVLITEAEPFNEPGPRIIYVNDAFTKMTGYTAEEIIGKTPRILQGPKSDKKELLRLRKALENWESCEITLINYKKNGEEFWINLTVNPVVDEKGWFTHWIAIERDVTLRKNEELQNELIADISTVFNESAKLHETLDKTLRLITDFGGFCFAEAWITGSQKNILLKVSTHSATDNMKLFLEETNAIETFIQGEGFVGIVAGTKQSVIWGDLANQKALRRRETILKYGIKTLLGVPLLSNNEVIGVLAFGLDYEVSNGAKYAALFNALSNYLSPEIKRKQLEQELNQLFNFAPDVIVIADMNGYFKRINPAACKLLDYTEQEIYAVPYANFIHPDDRGETTNEISKLVQGNHTYYFENRYITKSGKVKWLAWNATYSTEENNIYGVAKDITEKKELENLLQKANELARIGGWEVDIHNNTIFWSEITKEIHEVAPDYNPELKTGVNFYKKGSSRNKINRYIKQGFKTGKSWDDEFQIVTGKGNERWVRVIGEVELVNGNYNRIYGSFQDIDDRKKAEEKIKNSEERQKLIMNAALDAIVCIDIKGIITFWNPQAEQIFGWNASEVVGRLLSEVIIPESYRTLHENGMKKYLKTGRGPALNVLLQLSAVKRNGEHFPIELTVLPILQDGEEFFCAFIRDISERKAYESRLIELNVSLEKQKAELIVSNNELEQFAYIASHDLQEPLRMVTSFMTLLNKKYGSNFDETATSYIDFAIDGAKRMRQLILDLLEYSRVGKMTETTEFIDLNTLIEEIKILCRKQIEEHDASVIVFGTLPLIKSYKAPLLQLFQNLISNALKYKRNGIRPLVKISFTSLHEYWQFVVEDNGIGIDEEYFDKIFVIFQRLHNKDEYSGTGMGLAVSKKIVEAMGGKIWLESTVNTGTKFYFTIPKK
jgi:PAS domain S-box-containing protein